MTRSKCTQTRVVGIIDYLMQIQEVQQQTTMVGIITRYMHPYMIFIEIMLENMV